MSRPFITNYDRTLRRSGDTADTATGPAQEKIRIILSHRQNISSRICQIGNNFPAPTSSLLTRPRTRHALRPFELTDKRHGTKIYNPRSEADDSNVMYIALALH